jgi:hypothetical protein
LHATVLLAIKYSVELNKFILLMRVICEKYRFRGPANLPSPQCSSVVIESSFDPGERLQAPGSLWLVLCICSENTSIQIYPVSLSYWFQTRWFLCEFPIGSYVKLSTAVQPSWSEGGSCVVIESSFDPGEQLQAPGSLWLNLDYPYNKSS